jgi:hypothetical protein
MTIKFIPTRLWPQADRLEGIIATVKAISNGESSYQQIAHAIGEFEERHGRYYRHSSELLGFTRRTTKNRSIVTPLGEKLLRAKPSGQNRIIRKQVLNLLVTRSLLAVLASAPSHSTSRDKLQRSLSALSGTTKEMVHRRLSTVLTWLDTLGVIRKIGHEIRLEDFSNERFDNEVELPVEVPVIPKPSELRLFKEVAHRYKKMAKTIRIEVDSTKLDRANQTHERLRSLVKSRIKKSNAIPTSNELIDVATHIDGEDFIIEVKSAGESIHQQVRKGLAQLYEYRYLQALPRAKLVLVLETRPSGKHAWISQYLCGDRGIYLVWDASGDDLFTTEDGKKALPFMQ